MRNLRRNRLRSLLTLASVAISLFLLTLFCAAYRFTNMSSVSGGADLLLVVEPRTSLMQRMPLSYQKEIAAIRGVRVVSPFMYFGGYFGASESLIPALGLDPQAVFKVFREWSVPDNQKQDFLRERSALIAGRRVAERYGWKPGDHIVLSSRNFHLDLDLILRAVYTTPKKEDEGSVIFHWDYWSEVSGESNRTMMFWVMADSAEDAPRLTRAIDAHFHNAPIETRTETLKQVFLDFIALLGNVKLILLAVSGAVVFAVLLVLANTMAMSIRERTTEMAVLRALGFRPRQLIGLLIGESATIALAGDALACFVVWAVSKVTVHYGIGSSMPAAIKLEPATIGVVTAVALGISLVSTLIPAFRASRIRIAQALRYVG